MYKRQAENDPSQHRHVQGQKTGSLLEFDPVTGETRCLATGFWYANGVDISADGSYALVAESPSAAVYKHWLQGPKVRPGACDAWWVPLTVAIQY